MKKSRIVLWFEYVAISTIVIAFFVISYVGFYSSDDLSLVEGHHSSIMDVFRYTIWFYFHLGGRFFSVASCHLLCGLISNRIWFDIVNTLFFLLLIIICGLLIAGSKKNSAFKALVFALLFWFFCPVPNETLFWAAGAITHLWADTLAFVFLWFFLKYKDDNFSVIGKTGLFFMSMFAAAEFIPCASICGALVVYYGFHIKKLKKNAVPFVVGFIIGSLFVLFAPGNFERAVMYGSYVDRIKKLLAYPIQEMMKYKALWIFLVVFLWGWRKNNVVVRAWVKKNSILLLSLGWSVVAFSLVFRPDKRALLFTETLSLVLFLRFLFDNYDVIKIRFIYYNLSIARKVLITILFAIFIVDSVLAVAETKKQSNNNEMLLERIKDSEGVVALDLMISSHRMACVATFPNWTWEPLAKKLDLDTVHIYPYFCQDKFYRQKPPLENTYVEKNCLVAENDSFGKLVRLIIRVEDEDVHKEHNHIAFTIDYTRPRKWYKSWLDKWRNYQYDRTVVVEKDRPDVCFDGYCYYIVWLGRENAENLKSVKYNFE